MHFSWILLLFWCKTVCSLSVQSVVDAVITNDRNTFVWSLCSLSSATEKKPQNLSHHCQYWTLKESCNFGSLQCNSSERSGLQPMDRPAQRIIFLLGQSLTAVIPENKFREYQEWVILKQLYIGLLNMSLIGEVMLYFSNSEFLFQDKNKHTSTLGNTDTTLLQ